MTEKATTSVKSQSQKGRFIETSKQLEVDESGKSFEDAFRRVVPPKTKRVLFGDKQGKSD
jgi:hypothetical protein